MQLLPVPSAQDVVRLIKPTVPETALELVKYYSARRPDWNYGPARRMAKPVFSGELSLSAALEGCLRSGSPLGRKSNAEVAELIWIAAKDRDFTCFDLTPRKFNIRHDLSILVDPLFFFVEAAQVKIFWLQPRRRFVPQIEGMALLAEMMRLTFMGDFESCELELLNLSAPDGKERRFQKLTLSNLPSLPEETLREALQRFADAYDAVCHMGVRRKERRPGPSLRPDKGLFDLG